MGRTLGILDVAVEQDVDAIRQGYEHFNQTGSIDLSQFDEEAEFDATGRVFDRAVYRGHEEIRQYFAQLREIWERQVLEPQDFVEIDDKIVVPVRITTIGKGSGVKTTSDAAHVWTIRAGKVVRLQIFQSREEALEATRLSE
jgi:ketosteroid isomerase-like protein